MRSSLRTANQLAAARPRGSPASPFSYICPDEGVRAPSERLRDGMCNACAEKSCELLMCSFDTHQRSSKANELRSRITFCSVAHLQLVPLECYRVSPTAMILLPQPYLRSRNPAIEFDSPYTATSVQHLLASGAVITAKTQMDEFGMGNMTINLPPGSAPVHNPWKPEENEAKTEEEPRSAGGSSGGSAAAVKAGLAWA